MRFNTILLKISAVAITSLLVLNGCTKDEDAVKPAAVVTSITIVNNDGSPIIPAGRIPYQVGSSKEYKVKCTYQDSSTYPEDECAAAGGDVKYKYCRGYDNMDPQNGCQDPNNFIEFSNSLILDLKAASSSTTADSQKLTLEKNDNGILKVIGTADWRVEQRNFPATPSQNKSMNLSAHSAPIIQSA